ALLESAGDAASLERRYVEDGLRDLLEGAVDASRAVGWLLRAKSKAPAASARARAKGPFASGYSGGVLGLSAPTCATLLKKARAAAIAATIRGWSIADSDPAEHALRRPGLTERSPFYVVDDDASTRDALTAFLTEQGGKVVAFSDELSLFAAAPQ